MHTGEYTIHHQLTPFFQLSDNVLVLLVFLYQKSNYSYLQLTHPRFSVKLHYFFHIKQMISKLKKNHFIIEIQND